MAAALWRKQNGQATLEAALVMPLLLTILIGMVGVALILHSATIVLLAANRGARVGAVVYGDATLTPDEQRQKVVDTVKATLGASLNGTDYDIAVTPVGDDLNVTVTYRLHLSLPWIDELLGGHLFELVRTAVYRIEPQ